MSVHNRQSRQVVDPFVAAKPVQTPVAGPKPSLQPASLRSRLAIPTASEHRRPASTIDGLLVRPSSPAHTTPVDIAQPSQVAQPSRPLPAGPLHVKYQPKPRPTQPLPVQSMPASPRPQLSASEAEQQAVAAITAPLPAKTATALAKARRQKTARVSTWALLGLLVIGGLSLFSQVFGEVAIALYGIVALWRRWPSQQTFALALAMFVGIIISSLVSSMDFAQAGSFEDMSRNLAVYAFLLLCIGTVALAREVRHESRQTA